MSLIRQFAIRNELLYSGFVLPNVQIFFVQKISFATFGVSIDDFLTRYAGLGYSLCGVSKLNRKLQRLVRVYTCQNVKLLEISCCGSYIIIEPMHEISNDVVCATSKGSDQPVHTRSLIRAFASHLSILWLLSY